MTEELRTKIQKLIEEKHFEEAIKLCDEAIEKNDKDSKLYVGRASLKNVIGRYEDAIKDYDIAIELNDKDPQFYWQRGYSKSSIIDYNGAIEDYDTAIKLGINDPKIFLDRGIAKSYLCKYKEAINDFNISIKLNPCYAEAYNFIGSSKLELGLYNDCINDFNTAIKLNPYYHFAYANRALLNMFFKNYDQALKDYDFALKIDSTNVIYYRYRAQIKYILGMYGEAIDDAEKAINLYNKYMDAHYIKILSKAKLKKYIEIIDDLKYVAKINTDFRNNFITDIMNLLESYYSVEVIFQLLMKNENAILWRNEPITNLISRFDESKNFDDKLKENIKYILLYEYFLLKILTFDTDYSEEENNNNIKISHYTSLDILLLLLNVKEYTKESGNIRINNITTANDPKEGKILERILNKNNISIKIENDEKALTLQTSYSRNKDSLTMFRLYGKKENKEATGICLVLDNKYFNNTYTSPYSYEFKLKIENNQIEMNEKINKEKLQENKRNLYWVLYYNDKENQLIYNKEKSKYASNIIDLNDLNSPNYKADLKEDDKKEDMIKYAFAKIFHYTEEIKKQIEDPKNSENYKNIKNQLYSYLFENIKYIIKHEAFFEEQELRMLVTNDYKSDEILIDNYNKKLYIDYIKLFDENNNYIKEIIIGSKVENNEAVAEYIRKVLHSKNTEMNKLDDIKVSISEAPLR
ncbi:hypothetical protein R4J03_05665 [Brachyspira intermedia]|uniref:tetratricopeptide repeat protein n=1 Tax=Brachyspira intermedia TaxID=84377 RepID=UPI0026177B3F|nr:tetratricopeptide repeat protein [uncultured Brachyspira sp.]